MSYIETWKQIKKGEIHSLYLCYGSETYLIEDIVQAIISRVLDPDERDMKLMRFDMRETPVETAIEEAYTFPFMGGTKVVIIQHPYFLTGQKPKEKIEHDLQQLADYAERKPEETIFIVQAPYEKLDERKKAVKQLRKHAAVMEAAPLTDKELRSWLDTRAKTLGAVIDDTAKEKLLSLTGDNLLMLTSELNKLSVHSDDGSITAAQVEALTARSLEHDIFALVDHVVQKRTAKAIRIYRDLIKQKEAPIKIASLMVRQFRILYQVKQLMQQGYGEKMIASRLKLHPFAVKLAGKQVRNFSSDVLLDQIDALAELDFRIKSGAVEDVLGVELYLLGRSVPEDRRLT
ncbi:DNA polymerase III subunit delta [Bacillus daqingensis]|uniref:DNA polymerase III subunit delta n=1 Tax=Bacillus daqingensis TaxID=872396 RepID=A0ABV9P2U1_9BACI